MNAFNNQFITLNPANQAETILNLGQVTSAFILTRADGNPLEGQCGLNCAENPCSCEMFSCSSK